MAQCRSELIFQRLSFSLLCHLERVLDLDSEVPDRALELGVPQEDLDGAQVFGSVPYS